MTDSSFNGQAGVFPFLTYDDAPAAIDWLGNAFGFEKTFVAPGSDGTIAHAELRLGTGTVMLGSAQNGALDMKRPRELSGVSQGIYVYVPDVDMHYDRAKAACAIIVRELANTDYGSREYAARDPEGYLWSIGTYLPE